MENTSTALSLVAEGLDWQPGDNVVGAALEFPSNVYPWMGLASRGVEYRRVEERDGRIDPDEILALLDSRTRMLALSWVQYASGFRSDLARLGRACRERGILFVVDVIQGLGALPLDVEADFVDVAAASAHKWLLGPEGIGLLYVSDRVVERLRPARSGWRSMRDFQWTDSTSPGTRVPGASRAARSTPTASWPWAAPWKSCSRSAPRRSSRGCSRWPTSPPAGSGTWDSRWSARAAGGRPRASSPPSHPRRSAQDLIKPLDQRGSSSPPGPDACGSPHFYNTADEIERCLAELAELT